MQTNLAVLLKERFPWLGTEDEVDCPGAVSELSEMYGELLASAYDGSPLRCPHCGHDGKTLKSITNKSVRESLHVSKGFRYLEDIVNYRDLSPKLVTSEGYGKPTLVVEGYYESGEGYDDGDNPRLECRACLGEFPIPEGLEVDFV